MRRVALLLIVTVGAVLASCHASEDSTAPEHRMLDGVEPRASLNSGVNCNMDGRKCDILRAGIDYLLNHANETCRNVGQVALERFEASAASGDGYQEAAQVTGYDMGVPMVAGNSYSGQVPVTGYVDVYPSFWSSGYTDPAHTGALLAHEEKHQDAMDNEFHTTGIANSYQAACLNPAA